MKPPSSPTRSTMSVDPVGWSMWSASWTGVAAAGSAGAIDPAVDGAAAEPPQAATNAARTMRAGTNRRLGVGMDAGRAAPRPGSLCDACHNRGMARDLHRPIREAWIVDAVRTPIGRYGGALASVRPDDLAAVVIRSIVDRTGIDAGLVEDVILGCANQAGEDNRNIARMAALLAGLPVQVAGQTVNRLCGSGLQAVNAATHAIGAGDGDVYIAGGVESMSRAPYSMPKAEAGFSFGNLTAWDTALGWRYPNPVMKEKYGTDSMGETAENIAAERPHLTREKQDAFALRSHRCAIEAIDSGRFAQEIIPVTIPQKKGEPKVIDTDERPRRDTTIESLSKLKPAFKKEGGTVTAGNSSGLNDGAAALLIMSEEKAKA